MPLGQAPFGTRQPPDPGDPRPPSRDLPRTARFIWMAGLAVLLAFGASRLRGASKSGPRADPGPNECITDRSCAEGWRCYAIPKDDPFVVTGVCAQLCEGDLQCPARFRCETVAIGDHQVVPVGARGATGTPLGICTPSPP